MPEYVEIYCNGKLIGLWKRKSKIKGDPLQLKSIWIDPTKAEQEYARKNNLTNEEALRYKHGLAFKLRKYTKLRRATTDEEREKDDTLPGYIDSDWHKSFFPSWTFGNGPDLDDEQLYLDDPFTSPRFIHFPFDCKNKQKRLNTDKPHISVHEGLHTISFVFSDKQWAKLVDTPRDQRGFSIAIGLDFGHSVLAFLSLDKIAKVEWSPRPPVDTQRKVFRWKRKNLRQTDVVDDFPQFLQDLVDFDSIRSNSRSARNGYAISALASETVTLSDRTILIIFAGAGKYTLIEIFHMAGISINITELELFESLPVLSRLVAAYYHFVFDARQRIMGLVEQFLVPQDEDARTNHPGILLALSASDREWYSEHVLRVYGQHIFRTSLRHLSLIKNERAHFMKLTSSMTHVAEVDENIEGEEETDFEHGDLDDELEYFSPLSANSNHPTSPHVQPFEPTLVRMALESADPFVRHSLGRGIFGDHWDSLREQLPNASVCQEPSNLQRISPLLKYYASKDGGPGPTLLDLAMYSEKLLLSAKDMTATSLTVDCFEQTSVNGKHEQFAWTVYPLIPNGYREWYPDNKLPEPRTSKTKFIKRNLQLSTLMKTENFEQLSYGDAEEHRVLTIIRKQKKVFTVGPTEFYPVPRKIEGDRYEICPGLVYDLATGNPATEAVDVDAEMRDESDTSGVRQQPITLEEIDPPPPSYHNTFEDFDDEGTQNAVVRALGDQIDFNDDRGLDESEMDKDVGKLQLTLPLPREPKKRVRQRERRRRATMSKSAKSKSQAQASPAQMEDVDVGEEEMAVDTDVDMDTGGGGATGTSEGDLEEGEVQEVKGTQTKKGKKQKKQRNKFRRLKQQMAMEGEGTSGSGVAGGSKTAH